MLDIGVCCAAMSVSCNRVVTCWERADLLAVMFVVFCHFSKCLLVHIRIKGEVGAVKLFKPSSKIFYRPFQGGTFLWIFYVFFFCLVFHVFAMPLCASAYICALWSPAWKGLASWLSFVVSYCEFFVTFPLVFWVRCGT